MLLWLCVLRFFFLSSIAVVVVVQCVHFDSSPHKFTQRSSYFDGEKNVFLLIFFLCLSLFRSNFLSVFFIGGPKKPQTRERKEKKKWPNREMQR